MSPFVMFASITLHVTSAAKTASKTLFSIMGFTYSPVGVGVKPKPDLRVCAYRWYFTVKRMPAQVQFQLELSALSKGLRLNVSKAQSSALGQKPWRINVSKFVEDSAFARVLFGRTSVCFLLCVLNEALRFLQRTKSATTSGFPTNLIQHCEKRACHQKYT